MRALLCKEYTLEEIKTRLKIMNNTAIVETQAYKLNKDQKNEVDKFFSKMIDKDLPAIFKWTANFTETHFIHILNKRQEDLYKIRHSISLLSIEDWMKLQDYILELDSEWLAATHQYLKNLLYESHLELLSQQMYSMPDGYDMMDNLVFVLPDDDTIN